LIHRPAPCTMGFVIPSISPSSVDSSNAQKDWVTKHWGVHI
jgi:hypothetical protein